METTNNKTKELEHAEALINSIFTKLDELKTELNELKTELNELNLNQYSFFTHKVAHKAAHYLEFIMY